MNGRYVRLGASGGPRNFTVRSPYLKSKASEPAVLSGLAVWALWLLRRQRGPSA